MHKQKLTVLPVGAKGPNKIIMKHKGFLSEKKKKQKLAIISKFISTFWFFLSKYHPLIGYRTAQR